MIVMTEFEYEFLTRTWVGPKRAAYNAVYEFCKEVGWLKQKMDDWYVTPLGKEKIKEYENSY